jgi:hypothetical protein
MQPDFRSDRSLPAAEDNSSARPLLSIPDSELPDVKFDSRVSLFKTRARVYPFLQTSPQPVYGQARLKEPIRSRQNSVKVETS